MLKQYKYLYYRIYSWNLKKGEKDISQWKAVVFVSAMMVLNLFLIGLLLKYFGILEHPFPKKIATPLTLVLIGLNYFLFMHSGKYKLITREYEKENTKKRKKNTISLWLFIALSFLLPILLMVLIKNKYYS
jgi:NADH:ubiquinone oxidoreductase subunit 6 (subunit J)